MAKSGGICFPKVCFDLKLSRFLLIIFRPFWPAVSRLSFVSVSLVLEVTKVATLCHNYSLASGILRTILKACWPRCACGRLSRTKQQICQCLNSVDSAVFAFGSVYALNWNKVIDCRDRIGRVVCLCKWSTVLVGLPTGCSRRLLLLEYNVYLLICFVESMVTHSSHNSYKVGMTGLPGGSSEGFRSKP